MRLALTDGEGNAFTWIDLGDVPEDNGTLNGGDLPHGHLFIEIDGVAYGSLEFERSVGKPVITLGQYAPQFDQWAPQNPLTKPEEV
jgi:hypothetical protein